MNCSTVGFSIRESCLNDEAETKSDLHTYSSKARYNDDRHGTNWHIKMKSMEERAEVFTLNRHLEAGRQILGQESSKCSIRGDLVKTGID